MHARKSRLALPGLSMALLAITQLATACGPRYSVRAPPAAEMPRVNLPDSPVAPGTGRVVVDVPDGAADVEIKLSPRLESPGTSSPMGSIDSRWQFLCRTPCVKDLPAGHHDLSFRLLSDPKQGDSDRLAVTEGETTVYRRALTQRSGSPVQAYAGYTLASIGVTVLFTGLLLALVPTDPEFGPDESIRTAGLITLVIGAGITVGGGYLLYNGLPHTNTGNTTQFAIPPR
jgi:hypothetical protein